VERLARDVVSAAANAGWLDDDADDDPAAPFDPHAAPTPGLRHSVAALSRRLRHHHFPGDGCLEERPPMRLAGAALLSPAGTKASDVSYDRACRGLGVEARDEGWGLWHAWAENEMSVTLVVTCVDTTVGLLRSWAQGIKVDPATPLPAHIAAVRTGWFGPMVLSPRSTRRLRIDGE
jgi:hypothetical protein